MVSPLLIIDVSLSCCHICTNPVLFWLPSLSTMLPISCGTDQILSIITHQALYVVISCPAAKILNRDSTLIVNCLQFLRFKVCFPINVSFYLNRKTSVICPKGYDNAKACMMVLWRLLIVFVPVLILTNQSTVIIVNVNNILMLFSQLKFINLISALPIIT